jgi:hypothetical protein
MVPPNNDGAWLSLVERQLWELDVVGSNPTAPNPSKPLILLAKKPYFCHFFEKPALPKSVTLWRIMADKSG